jgi:hypothetical protein
MDASGSAPALSLIARITICVMPAPSLVLNTRQAVRAFGLSIPRA